MNARDCSHLTERELLDLLQDCAGSPEWWTLLLAGCGSLELLASTRWPKGHLHVDLQFDSGFLIHAICLPKADVTTFEDLCRLLDVRAPECCMPDDLVILAPENVFKVVRNVAEDLKAGVL